MPTPYRTIGDLTVVYPMYLVPKKIGDGAYPTYSLENYESRNPSFSGGRSAYYHLAYSLSDILPGIDLSLLRGFETMASTASSPYTTDEVEGEIFLAESYTPEQRERWVDFLHAVRA